MAGAVVRVDATDRCRVRGGGGRVAHERRSRHAGGFHPGPEREADAERRDRIERRRGVSGRDATRRRQRRAELRARRADCGLSGGAPVLEPCGCGGSAFEPLRPVRALAQVRVGHEHRDAAPAREARRVEPAVRAGLDQRAGRHPLGGFVVVPADLRDEVVVVMRTRPGPARELSGRPAASMIARAVTRATPSISSECPGRIRARPLTTRAPAPRTCSSSQASKRPRSRCRPSPRPLNR